MPTVNVSAFICWSGSVCIYSLQGEFLYGVQQFWISSCSSLRPVVIKNALCEICKRYISNYSPSSYGGRVIGFIPFPRVLVLCDIRACESVKLEKNLHALMMV